MPAPHFFNTIEQTPFSIWIRDSDSPFGFYFILLCHTIGLSLLVGGNAFIDLRILGMASDLPLRPLRRLYGLMWAGFAINATSGLLLLTAYPTKAFTNPVFYFKLTFIALAIAVMVRLKTRVFDNATLTDSEMLTTGRSLAKYSLVFWIGAITAGRLLAYTYKYILYGLLGTVFFHLHL